MSSANPSGNTPFTFSVIQSSEAMDSKTLLLEYLRKAPCTYLGDAIPPLGESSVFVKHKGNWLDVASVITNEQDSSSTKLWVCPIVWQGKRPQHIYSEINVNEVDEWAIEGVTASRNDPERYSAYSISYSDWVTLLELGSEFIRLSSKILLSTHAADNSRVSVFNAVDTISGHSLHLFYRGILGVAERKYFLVRMKEYFPSVVNVEYLGFYSSVNNELKKIELA
jgi:hypothetical protein